MDNSIEALASEALSSEDDTPCVVLYTDDSTGQEKISQPMEMHEANEKAKVMTQTPGITVLSVVTEVYGKRRVSTERNMRVWYRDPARDNVSCYSQVMTYSGAEKYADMLRTQGYPVDGLITQQMFLRKKLPGGIEADDQVVLVSKIAQEEQADKPDDPNEAMRAAVERMEKIVTRQDESRAMEAPETPRASEGRRHQALQWALKLLELKSEGLSLTDMQKAVSPEQVVKDAKVLEKYLKGTTPRTPRS